MLYTSDGRDVEMSVASTKAFYAQVAAGVLLACAITEAAGVGTDQRRHELLTALRDAARRDARPCSPGATSIADAARRFAPTKRYWAVVGNGANKVAAEEVRIKLSELCYKSIACDVTEDKKHIDLSSEPLILVCAAGLSGSTADDVAKEVAIFRAHKATPIVIADDGDERYPAAADDRRAAGRPGARRSCSRRWSGTCSATRRRWPSTPRRARCARHARSSSRPSATSASADAVLAAVRARASARCAEQFVDGLRSHRYDGHLEASTAVRLAGLLRDVLSDRPVEEYQAESGKVGTPAALVDDLVARADAGHRGADPAGRRHQAPGQDGHRRDLAQRRGRASTGRSCRPCSPPAPGATCSATAR